MRMYKLFIGVAFITPALIIALVVLRSPNKVSPNAPANIDYPDKLGNLLAKWEREDFTAITNNQEFQQKLRAAKITNESLLSETQKNQLYHSLFNFLRAYHAGQFETYRDFRVPVADFQMTPGVRDFLKTELGKLPADPLSQFEKYWATAPKELYTLLTAAALHSAEIEIISTNQPIAHVGFAVEAQENVGIVSIGPSVEFLMSPDRILQEAPPITYATLRIITKQQDKAYPVYCRFYWFAEKSVWLPLEMATAFSGPRELSFTF